MNYLVDKSFVEEDGSTRFFEFQKGRIDYEHDDNPHYKQDSLYLSDEIEWQLQLDNLFSQVMKIMILWGIRQ